MQNCDLDAMWDFRTQKINFQRQSGMNQVKLIVISYSNYRRYNLKKHEIHYTINVTHSDDYVCSSCLNGGEDEDNNCYCDQCQQGYSGAICSRKIINRQWSDFTLSLKPYEKVFYEFPPDEFFFSVQFEEGLIQVYVQQKTFDNEVATFYNVGFNRKDQRYEVLPSQRGLQIPVNYTNPILVTFFNTQNHTISDIHVNMDIFLSYMAIIIGSIIGGFIILLIIGIIVYCVLKKQQRINSELTHSHEQLSQSKLYQYFPSCPFQKLGYHKSMECSDFSITHSQSSLECSICIQPIKIVDQIMISYCKHIFHSSCLREWFKKQRICPYCRSDYNKKNTQEAYQNVCVSSGKDNLQGVQLARQIYKGNAHYIKSDQQIKM